MTKPNTAEAAQTIPSTALTLYNNGIGVFSREYIVNGKTQIKLTIPKDAIADLIASIRVLGKVTISDPISWPQETDSKLTIEADNAQLSLLTELTGRKIKLTMCNKTEVSGINMGIHQENKEKPNTSNPASSSIVTDTWVIIAGKAGMISRHPLSEIVTYQFEEAEVQAEIEKALMQASLRLREHTTVATLGLTAPDIQSAVVQYATPLPAWQPTYRLSLNGKSCTFDGTAKIDYTGEEDLSNCHVTLVVGDPDTFNTDLATPVIPTRNTVNFVKTHAEGGYGLESGVRLAAAGGGQPSAAPAPAMAMSRRKSVVMDPESFCPASTPMHDLRSANQPSANTAEIGDYSIWTTPSAITLRAKQSSLISLFDSKKIDDAEQLLYFNVQANPTRPKSAIQFKNSLTQSLGRGVCSIYQENELIGTADLRAVKTGESVILTYATETGVKVLTTPVHNPSKIHSIKVANGFLETTEYSHAVTEYVFDNIRKQEYVLTLDHTRVLGESEITYSTNVKQTEKLQNGGRFKGTLKSGQTKITINESRLDKRSVALVTHNLSNQLAIWQKNIPAKTLQENKQLQEIVALQAKLAAVTQEQTALVSTASQLDATTVRLMKYLENPEASTAAQKNVWREELASSSRTLSENEKRVTTLSEEINSLTNKIGTCLKTLDLSWKVG